MTMFYYWKMRKNKLEIMEKIELTKDLLKGLLDKSRPTIKYNTIEFFNRVQLAKLLLSQIIEEEREFLGDKYEGQYDELYNSLADFKIYNETKTIEPKSIEEKILDYWGEGKMNYLKDVDGELRIKMAYAFEEATVCLSHLNVSKSFRLYFLVMIKKILLLNQDAYDFKKLLNFCDRFVLTIDNEKIYSIALDEQEKLLDKYANLVIDNIVVRYLLKND